MVRALCTGRSSSKGPKLAAMAFVLVAAAACSSAPSGAPATTTSSAGAVTSSSASSRQAAAFPSTVTHEFGSTTVTAEPKSVVTIGFNEQDFALALGVTPVGVREFFGYDY